MGGELAPGSGAGLSRQTLGNSTWQFATVGYQGAVQLLVTAVLARLLSPADFGVVAIANIVVAFVWMVARLGFGQALVQRRELTPAHIRVAFTVSLLSGVLLAVLVALLAPAAAVFFHNPSVTGVLRALSLSFPLANLGLVAESLLVRELAFKKLFWATMVTYTFGYALAGVSLAALGLGVWALVAGALATSLLYSVAVVVLRPHPKRPSLAGQELGDLTRFGGGITLTLLLKYAANNGDHLVVGRWLGAAALGMYQQAFNLLILFARFLGDILERVLFATASRIQEQTDRMSRGYCRALGLVNLVLLPISAVMIILAPEIVRVYLGSKWQEAVLPAQILLIGLSFRSQSRISDAFVQAMGAVYQTAARKGVFALAVIAGSLLGLRWELPGVAAAVTLAMVVDYALVLKLGLRLTTTRWKDYRALITPGLTATVIAVAACWPAALLLRRWQAGTLPVLVGSLLITGLALAAMARLVPAVIGPDGAWLTHEVLTRVSRSRAIEAGGRGPESIG